MKKILFLCLATITCSVFAADRPSEEERSYPPANPSSTKPTSSPDKEEKARIKTTSSGAYRRVTAPELQNLFPDSVSFSVKGNVRRVSAPEGFHYRDPHASTSRGVPPTCVKVKQESGIFIGGKRVAPLPSQGSITIVGNQVVSPDPLEKNKERSGSSKDKPPQ